MNDETPYFVVQYRPTEHDTWKDDNTRPADLAQAKTRLERCSAAKIFRGAKWRIVKRTDVEV